MQNIYRTDHGDCARLEMGTDGRWTDNWHGRPGDVRRCVHGYLQLRTETPIHSRMQGPGTDWWRTLSAIFTPVLYRRAKKALA
jgi:hypothetical protein